MRGVDLLLLINANATKITNNQKDGPNRRNTVYASASLLIEDKIPYDDRRAFVVGEIRVLVTSWIIRAVCFGYIDRAICVYVCFRHINFHWTSVFYTGGKKREQQ